jgi:hypothetical protein
VDTLTGPPESKPLWPDDTARSNAGSFSSRGRVIGETEDDDEEIEKAVADVRREHPSMTKSAAYTKVLSSDRVKSLLRKSLERSRTRHQI